MRRPTHILFDFFGTLVDYVDSRTAQGYPRTHALLRGLGVTLPYDGFLAAWSRICADFDRAAARDDREFSMTQLGTAFLGEALGRSPAAADVDAFVDTYVAEWSTGVRHPPGIGALVAGLGAAHRLAVVSNTHHAPLVPGHLAAMGLLPAFDAVVTSVEVGWRKPHPEIYRSALDVLGVDAAAAVFVGDTYTADFAGPRRAGIEAYLIDPAGRAPVPDERRLTSIFDLPTRLGG